MRRQVAVQARIRRRRQPGLRLGPLWLWARRIPGAPKIGYGRIAVTDTPSGPDGDERQAVDGQGWTVVLGGVAFAVLHCRTVTLGKTSSKQADSML